MTEADHEDHVIDTILSGYQKLISVDRYDIRDAACKFRGIAVEAYQGRDNTAILNFAVFLRAAKQARLWPKHIAQWLAKQPGGRDAMANALGVELAERTRYNVR